MVDHDGGVDDVVWIDTANIQIDAGKTTFIVGRQQLDTPFFKSETWNIAPNTFDAAVAVNSNIPDTKIIGAWVGRGNGEGGYVVRAKNIGGGMHAFTEANKPAYAFGLINESIPNTTMQGVVLHISNSWLLGYWGFNWMRKELANWDLRP